jgi:hypothetical protein
MGTMTTGLATGEALRYKVVHRAASNSPMPKCTQAGRRWCHFGDLSSQRALQTFHEWYDCSSCSRAEPGHLILKKLLEVWREGAPIFLVHLGPHINLPGGPHGHKAAALRVPRHVQAVIAGPCKQCVQLIATRAISQQVELQQPRGMCRHCV